MQNRIDNMTKWIRTQVPEGGKAVLGISGGKDSTIAAALCVKALGKENVIGVMMPNGYQRDIRDSRKVCDLLDIFAIEVNIQEAYEGIVDNIASALNQNAFDRPKNGFLKVRSNGMIRTNLPARLRMSTLYTVAALYPNSRVVNTCNLSEDFVGYSTKYGDAAGDFSPLGDLTVREILAIGDALGLPYSLVHKAPSDGMCGKTDEDNLGFTYEQLDNYIDGDYDKVPDEVCEKIERLHAATRHKYKPIPTYERWRDNMNYAQKFFGHLKTVTKHKYWVWYYMNKCGLKWGWRGLWHDMSKFSPTEFWESVKYYSGTRSPIDACKEENGISMAWMHHKGRNPHHYEYWMDNFDKGGEPKEMPWRYKVEMICDYLAAGRAYMGKNFSYKAELEWWRKKLDLPRAQHDEDKAFVSRILEQLAYEEEMGGHKHATKMLKYSLLVFKDLKYGGCHYKV